MTEGIWQCCYTNETVDQGASVSSGWQAVAVSEGLPTDAFGFCTRLQGVNSRTMGPMHDEHGNILDLYEVQGDGTYLYVVRSKYGLLDRVGRQNMFSHAYVIPIDEKVLKDANEFLTIANSNFAASTEEAGRRRPAIERDAPFDHQSALERAGLSPETYLTLVRSVFLQMSETAIVEPLYVGYDGTEEQMRAMLYLIYQALPYGLRRVFGSASVSSNGAAAKNVVFTMRPQTHRLRFDPATGASTVAVPQMLGRIQVLGYPDHAITNGLDEGAANDYFRRLEETAKELGDAGARNPLTLKIAHQLICGAEVSQLQDWALLNLVSDVLLCDFVGNERMERFLAELIDEVANRGLTLSEYDESNIAVRIEDAATAELVEAHERYVIACISRIEPTRAAALLRGMGQGQLGRFKAALVKIDLGRQVLDAYYATVVLGGGHVTWDDLDACRKEAYALTGAQPMTAGRILELALGLFEGAFPHLGQAVEAYGRYARLVQATVGVDGGRGVPPGGRRTILVACGGHEPHAPREGHG